ncbi:MAG: lytic transglycosylase [Candidatus Saganbacteria bacterium]|uniref:Lytic transglycosylase n=1 Tax=Candidatus Saganbacteria bacterium TaxID=2575572 RepID=A0A833KZG1_UNCSA|nr:MAG: lytic transglycosylase [Candidatus Saganbacteria bacterium]
MPKSGKPIDSNIKCPWCGVVYPDIRRNGSYEKDKNKIPIYYCKKCNKGFSASVFKVKIIKPQKDIEIGNKIKIEINIAAERSIGIKNIRYETERDKKAIDSGELQKQSEKCYSGVWNLFDLLAGWYVFNIIILDTQGLISIHSKKIQLIQHYDELIRKIAKENEIDQFLVKGLIWKESSFNPQAISSANAKGLMQLNDITIKDIENKEKYTVKNPLDPEQNIRGGVFYIKRLIERFGNLRIALGAYNWGPSNVVKNGLQEQKFPKKVKNYIDDVLKYKEICEKEYYEYYENIK